MLGYMTERLSQKKGRWGSMGFIEKYNEWLKSEFIDDSIKEELYKIKDDKKEIEDRFYKELEFGTGGIRGKIGAGTNRINVHIIEKVTQGLANYLLNESDDEKSVAIAYDCRHKSREFAETATKVLAANNVKVYLFNNLRSTPELSFSVRHLKCNAGIVITASHNPAEYNGYKVYGSDGGQLVPKKAKKLIEKIKEIDCKDIKKPTEIQKRLINFIGEEVDKKYIEQIKQLSLNNNIDKEIKIVYTPLHGTGNMPVTRVLNELGYNVTVVKEQEKPDPDFLTVESPNPEERSAFQYAIKLAYQVNADIILGTDPDCDRVGLIVKNSTGNYTMLNGNQTGALLIKYILSTLKEKNGMPKNGAVIKTIVTSEMGRVIAKGYGVECIDTLTGFKFIGEKIKEFEENDDYNFIFGYEESYGYLAGTFVRDKDAVIASMLISEMAAYYKQNNLSLCDELDNLYKKYGYYVEETLSMKFDGILGQKKILRIMDYFRERKPCQILDEKVNFVNDYEMQITYNLINGDFERITLPKSNVLKFVFEGGSWFVLRPSGTEPKIKIYFSINGTTLENAKEILQKVKEEIIKIIKKVA